MALVLIVDDDCSLLGLLSMAMHMDGLDTLTTSNSSEGLSLALSMRPDVIILDGAMPEMNGFEFAEMLRRAETERTPILMLTALSAEEDRARAMAVGIDDYVVKPCGIAELRGRVSSLLGRELAPHLARNAPTVTRGRTWSTILRPPPVRRTSPLAT